MVAHCSLWAYSLTVAHCILGLCPYGNTVFWAYEVDNVGWCKYTTQCTYTHTVLSPIITLMFSGEEGEKKIVQVPARLYAFDLDTHTWKERGRGEIRLNDAAQSEGLFQSRLGEK